MSQTDDVRRRLVAPTVSSAFDHELFTVLDDAPLPFIAVDRSGAVVGWNKKAASVFGWARGYAAIEDFADAAVVPGSRSLYDSALADVRAARSPSEGTRIRLRDGAGREFAAGLLMWTPSAPEAGVVCILVGEDPQTSPSDRRFLADAAHQLRTPMAGIRLAAENLLVGVEPPDQHRLFASLMRETARASRLVTQLLRVAELDERLPLVPAPCDFVALCESEIERAWSLAPDLEFILEAQELPGPIEADAGAVCEALGNLLDNARRHARSRIAVKVERVGCDVEVRVDDDGPGIPRGWEERIFERFVSLGGGGGSGLGLAIARDLALAHGGDLLYGPGGFRLRLPFPGSEGGVVVDLDE